MAIKQIFCKPVLAAISRGASTSPDVPKGFFAVYVGESQKKGFVIPLSLLNQPLFQDLLSKAEEFGFKHRMGGVTIPSHEDVSLDVTSRPEYIMHVI